MAETEKKNHLLLMSVSLGQGGAESHLVRIANSLADQYQVHIAVVRDHGSYTSLVSEQAKIHCVGSKWANRSTLLASHFSARKLAKLIDTVTPVCVISFLEPVTYACYRAKKYCRHRFVHLVAIQNNLEQCLKTLNGLARRPVRIGVMKAIENADGIVAISGGVAGNVIQMFPGVESRVRTIYNAAFETLPPIAETGTAADFARPTGCSKIVACGRLTEQKGFCDLLNAFRIVRDQLDAKLDILGTGPLLDQLQRQTAELGVEDDVNFIGFQSDPLAHFRAADLFVLSSWWEGFGNVIVEAMSVATAVVSTDCPYGPSEIIEHGVNGMLVPPRSPNLLAEQMIEVLRDGELRATLAANGRLRSSDFLADTIAGQYAEFIEESIHCPRS